MKEKDQQYFDFSKEVGSLFGRLNELHKRQLEYLIPQAHRLIKSQSKDVRAIEKVLDSLFDLVLFDIGVEIHQELLAYLASFDPILASQIQEANDGLLRYPED